jgi:hypothetical protein
VVVGRAQALAYGLRTSIERRALHERTTQRFDDLTELRLVELLAVVDFFNGSNAIASGLMVEYEPPVFAEPDVAQE